MPTLQRPRTDQELTVAALAILAQWGLVTVNARPFDIALLNQLIVLMGTWEPVTTAVATAKTAQLESTKVTDKAGLMLEYNISHFIQGFDNAGLREVYLPEDRAIFGLPGTGKTVPKLDAHADRLFWARNLAKGESARALKEGLAYKAMANPTIEDVNAALTDYETKQGLGITQQENYDLAQEAVAPHRPGLMALIAEIWDAIEYYYRHDDPPSRRRKCRRWGLVYVTRPGETPDPDEPPTPPAPTPPNS